MNPPNCWNYRVVVVKVTDSSTPFYKLVIREVYYNQAGHPFTSGDADLQMIVRPYEPEDHFQEFKQDIEWMLKAFDKPVLNEDLDEVSKEDLEKMIG